VKAPFPITPVLTAIAIAYRNARLIGDAVLPRVPVSAQVFKYRKFALQDGFTVPDTKVGRTGKPGQIEFGFTEVEGSTKDYALDDPIPNADIENAPQGYDPEGKATESLTDLIALDREIRCANLVFAAGSYATANKVQLTGNDQWNEYAQTASDPIEDIMTGLDSMVMRANIMVLGNAVASALRRHPRILKAYNGTTGDTGIVPLAFLRDLFELEEVLVGQAWVNSAKKGQAATLARVWGNHCSLIYRDSLAGVNDRVSFGYTAQWGDRVAGSIPDPDIGMRGGQRVRVGESVAEIVAADNLGYFIQDAI
jgi:hypothetical protein